MYPGCPDDYRRGLGNHIDLANHDPAARDRICRMTQLWNLGMVWRPGILRLLA
jgi:hypothetical protein